MSCLLPLIAGLCLADPSNLSIIADASVQTAGSFTYRIGNRSYGGAHVGRLAIEMQAPLTRTFTLRYGIAHTSLLDTDTDRGEERTYIGFTFRPFARSASF